MRQIPRHARARPAPPSLALVLVLLGPAALASGAVGATGGHTPDPSHFVLPLLGWVVDGRWLLVFGFAAQALFAARMLVQLRASARCGASVVPPEFWRLSLTAGIMLAIYFFARSDPVGFLHQAVMVVIYLRNIQLLRRARVAQASAEQRPGRPAGLQTGHCG